jgi:hypothetical protein
MYAVASMSTKNIHDLSNATDAPKIEYCERHGYLWANLGDDDIIIRTEPFSNFMDFNKPLFIKKLFEQHPEFCREVPQFFLYPKVFQIDYKKQRPQNGY